VVPGTDPKARKVRWKRQGSGKRGGVRIVYYHLDEDESILLSFLYAKSERETMKAKEINKLFKKQGESR
jgi:hypothetical protein